MAAFFDIIALACFGAATAVTIYMLVVVRNRSMTASAAYLMGAMALMAVMSATHIAEQWNRLAPPDVAEDYAQILFLPLVAYAMFSIHTQSLEARARRDKLAVDRLSYRLADTLEELGDSRIGVLQALSTAVDARDHYTALHSMHVADYACAIGLHMGLTDHLLALEQAGLLHDIGKIGIPDSVLLKPARLDDDEYTVIKTHVEASAHILETVSFLNDVIPVVRHHHERWDGTGYPDGLSAEEIPAGARVLAVADAFDAMTTDRPYRAAMDIATARSNLLEGRGSQFDPAAVYALLSLLDMGLLAVGGREVVA